MYEKICENCGTRLSDFYRTGMLGCSDCYEVFKTEIEETLLQIQAGSVHTGKTLPFSSEEKMLLSTYENLFKEKERAVMEGRFTDVKIISERLSRLREELREKGLI